MIYGNVVGGLGSKSDWNQTDVNKSDYIKNKPTKVSDFTNDTGFLVAEDIEDKADKTEITSHNVSNTSHNDIRLLVTELTNRLNALANSDDTTLDQMSEIVAYIKSNRTLIESITTDKINVADIVDNLTTNVSNKSLSAAQGVALKALIDAIEIPTKTSDLTNDSNFAVDASYVHTDNNYTTAEKTKLNGIESNANNYSHPDQHPVSMITGLSNVATSGSYDDLSDKPVNVSEFTNDSGYLTSHQSLSEYAKITDLPIVPTNVSAFTNDIGYLTEHQSLEGLSLDGHTHSYDSITNKPTLSTVATSGSYNDLSNKPTIPTKVSQLSNDSGYLTSHQDISGKANVADLATVATSGNYADLLNKPIIPNEYTLPTASSTVLGGIKVGAGLAINSGVLSATGGGTADSVDWSNVQNKPTLSTVATSGSYEDLSNKPTIPTVPTNISSFNNDSGYLTQHQDISGKADKTEVTTHNTAVDAHNDIRLLITGLTNRLNALADSDDTTLDQMSEIVEYIENNRSLIENVTTNKINVSDIIDNLTTNVDNKPLSAAQGVALKNLIDAITIPTKTSDLTNDSNFVSDANYIHTDSNFTSAEKTKLSGIATNANNYSLPTASDTTLGGIRVGANLTITDGVLSANAGSYSLPTASAETLGGVKVGAGLTIASGVLSADGAEIPQSDTAPDDGSPLWIQTNIDFPEISAGSGIYTGDTAPTGDDATNNDFWLNTSVAADGGTFADVVDNYLNTNPDIPYDNTDSGLTATTYTGAIDELAEGWVSGTLTPATTTTLGGIKVGNNLEAEADGTLNALAGIVASPTQPEDAPEYWLKTDVDTPTASHLIGDTIPIGAVMEWDSSTPPTNWLLLNGQAISRTIYSELFELYGTNYGAGDGLTTFNLPDRRGKFSLGVNDNHALGTIGGEETHLHTLDAGYADIIATSDICYENYKTVPRRDMLLKFTFYQPQTSVSVSSPYAVALGGTTDFSSNMPPYIAVNFIVKAKQSSGVLANVVDNLDSTSTTDALSANQGKVLADSVQANTDDIIELRTKIGYVDASGSYSDIPSKGCTSVTFPLNGVPYGSTIIAVSVLSKSGANSQYVGVCPCMNGTATIVNNLAASATGTFTIRIAYIKP